jgi:nucleoside-diphosphate-sugar epimerase
VRRAIVLGGNGLVGSAVALKLISAGWEVTSSGRTQYRFPRDLREAGVRFIVSDRYAARELRQLLHDAAAAPEGLGDHPWNTLPPFLLDTSAAERLGFVPMGGTTTPPTATH